MGVPLFDPGVDDIPEVRWMHGDDLCDCSFQRIGEWTNPYIAKTLRVRFCCIWEELHKQYPDFVQTIPGYFDENDDKIVTDPAEWDGDTDMPRALWHRQIQAVTNRPLDEIRKKFAHLDPPKGR
jgi:hypothetical protein